MKKYLLILAIATITTTVAKAQLDFSSIRVDVGGNYTMYKGDFQRNTPGVKLRLSVPDNEKMAIGLGFTYGFPIKQASEVPYTDGSTVASEFSFNFKTISLEWDYYLGGDNEEGFSVYASGRAGLVLVSGKEKLKGTPPAGEEPLYTFETVKENGFSIGLALGGQYALGRARIFADAGLAFPANQVNGVYVENVIPTHFTFNAGLRFSLGSGGE